MTSVLLLWLVHPSSMFTGTRATERRAVSRVCPLNPERERELSPPSPRGERRGEEEDPAGAQGRSLAAKSGAAFRGLFLPAAPRSPQWGAAGSGHVAVGPGPDGRCCSGLSFLQ